MRFSGRSLFGIAATLALVSLLAACATSGAPGAANAQADAVTLQGKLTYRERIALPPDAVARVTVRETSRADTRAPVIAQKTIEGGRLQVPIAFELAVPRDDLKPGQRYSLRASIKNADGQLLWTTDTAHGVDRDESVNDMGMIQLVQAGAQTRLTGTEWVVENIAGGGIIDSSRATLNFAPDGQLSGRASCNRYHGRYERTGNKLEISRLASTMMACAPALNKQEQRFNHILHNAQSFEFGDNGKLILTSSDGQTLEARASD